MIIQQVIKILQDIAKANLPFDFAGKKKKPRQQIKTSAAFYQSGDRVIPWNSPSPPHDSDSSLSLSQEWRHLQEIVKELCNIFGKALKREFLPHAAELFPLFPCVCLLTPRRQNVQFAMWDQRRHGRGRREARVLLQDRKYLRCRVKSSFPHTRPGDVLFLKLFATSLAQFMHRVVLLSSFLSYLKHAHCLMDPGVYFAPVIGAFINYRL